jgi:PAS domain S-box-containing protein
MVGHRFWGFLGFDDCKVERVWSKLEIEVLQTATALIAGAVERAQAGEQLRLSEERYKMAARGANDGLWDWDIVSGLAYFSPRLHELLHLEEGTLESNIEALLEHFLPEDVEALQEGLARRFARERQKFEYECRTRRADGSIQWFVLRGLIVYSEGYPRRIVGALRDITARKMAEAQLVDSEARARAVVETALDAIITTDEQGRVAEFNPAAERIFGWSAEQAVGRSIAELLFPDIDVAFEHGLAHLAGAGAVSTLGRRIETFARRADGRRIPIEMSVTEVRLEGRTLFTTFLRDIAERREFQRQLTEAERKRANLARYFSPNMVDELMRGGGDLQKARTQVVTVLFVDVIGFTAVSAELPGIEVIALLRRCLGLFEEAVFTHGGTLDKYLGDGLMATFGTPQPGPRDATNAVACARTMTRSIVAWNGERREQGLEPLRIGIGLHHGEVVLGDIGSERRLEFAVLGDTVNVASRIQDMTRPLDIAILASEAVMGAVEREGGGAYLAAFRDVGVHGLRGRQGALRLWGCAAEPADR